MSPSEPSEISACTDIGADLLLTFHPAAIGASVVDTPFGAMR